MLIVACHFYISSVSSTYTAYIVGVFTEDEIDYLEAEMSVPGVVEITSIERLEGTKMKTTFKAVSDGETEVDFGLPSGGQGPDEVMTEAQSMETYLEGKGIAIEGMGSETKAYFWPNALLREFVGLLVDQWKNILQTHLVTSLAYALLQSVDMFL